MDPSAVTGKHNEAVAINDISNDKISEDDKITAAAATDDVPKVIITKDEVKDLPHPTADELPENNLIIDDLNNTKEVDEQQINNVMEILEEKIAAADDDDNNISNDEITAAAAADDDIPKAIITKDEVEVPPHDELLPENNEIIDDFFINNTKEVNEKKFNNDMNNFEEKMEIEFEGKVIGSSNGFFRTIHNLNEVFDLTLTIDGQHIGQCHPGNLTSNDIVDFLNFSKYSMNF
jgi:hypothetical protein